MFLRTNMIRVALLATLGLAGTSCEKALDLKPFNSLDATQVFVDQAGVNAGVIGMYSGLTSADYYGLRYPVMADLAADNIAHLGTFPSFAEIKNRNIQPQNAEITNIWAAIYRTINRANNVIEYVPGVASVSEANRNVAVAEARFIRALCYFDLVRYWGDVPLVLTATKAADASLNVSRSPIAAVYDQVKLDLDAAEAGLSEGSAARANKGAARALKARLALYRGQFTEAATLADQVIATSKFQLLADYRANFDPAVKNTAEAIFEVNFDNITQSQFAFFFFPGGAQGGRNEVGPAGTTLLTAYETGDLRRNASISNGTFSANGRLVPANVGIKYTRPNPGEDNCRVIRLAEVILIGAEAKVRSTTPDLTGALTLLNRVRTRAGLPASTASTSVALLAAIEQERRVELAMEGHRWFDLIRTNRAQAVLGITDARRLSFPIPLRETINNPNIKQNDGY